MSSFFVVVVFHRLSLKHLSPSKKKTSRPFVFCKLYIICVFRIPLLPSSSFSLFLSLSNASLEIYYRTIISYPWLREGERGRGQRGGDSFMCDRFYISLFFTFCFPGLFCYMLAFILHHTMILVLFCLLWVLLCSALSNPPFFGLREWDHTPPFLCPLFMLSFFYAAQAEVEREVETRGLLEQEEKKTNNIMK